MPVVLSRPSDDVVVRVNLEYTAAYGVEPGSAIGRPTRELHFHPEDRDGTLRHFQEGRLESFEVRVRHADDRCLWAQADVALFDFQGEPVLLTTFYDIGAKKSAERELAAHVKLMEEMARFPEMNPGPVARLELDGTVRRANGAANEVFGGSIEGRCFWELVPELEEQSRKGVLGTGGLVRQDVRVGSTWLSLTLACEEDSEQIFVYGTDITAQKVAEQELAERARFPEMNPGPVARLMADGTVHRANRAAERIFGQDRLQGLSFRELCPGIADERWEEIVRGGRPIQHEEELGDRTFSFTLVYEPAAEQVFVYGSDVTELKAAERALAELARFPEMNPGPVLRLDRKATVLLANQAAFKVFSGEDPAGKSWLELCPGVDSRLWSRILSAEDAIALEAKIEGRYYLFHHAPGPEGLFVFVYGSDITDEKLAEQALLQAEKMATLGTLTAGVAHELNNPAAAAQRAAEQVEAAFSRLQHCQVMLRKIGLSAQQESLLEEMDRHARDRVGHPSGLSAMERGDREAEVEDWLEERGSENAWEFAPSLVDLGYRSEQLDDLVARGAGGHAPTFLAWQSCCYDVYRLLDEIRHGSGRLVEIVGAMKAYSYLGQAPVQAVDVNEGLRNTLIILRSKLKEGVTVIEEFDPGLPLIEARGSELNQVWTNLLDNAVSAMDGRGRITLRSSLRAESIVVDVEDDGPGIPSEHQSRVFDAFFTTKPPGQGTGLGLHTTYNIVVTKHAGTIHLESQPGRTCFSVVLPIKGPEDLQDAPS